jgi:hypothetical protein
MSAFSHRTRKRMRKENKLIRALILWLLGVPFVLVLLIWYFFF